MATSSKETWKFILNLVASIITAALAALGTASCIRAYNNCEGAELGIRVHIRES